MAHPSYLKKVQARELDQAMSVIQSALGDDPEVSECIHIAQRDVVGRGDSDLRTTLLTGLLTRVVMNQQERIEQLEKQVAKPQRPARAKAG
jgi:hypothetical protein